MSGASSGPPILVATRSGHKLEEIRDILSGLPARLLSADDLGLAERPEEDELEPHQTFKQNALSKAIYFHRRSGLLTMADDSGLCVDALGGGPGVRTKRFAPAERVERWGRDEANNRYLLERLVGVAEAERSAHYRCAIAFAYDRGHIVFEGRVDGWIGFEPRGDGGFGYDPLFVYGEGDETYAELPAAVKRRTSHRARAVAAGREWLEAYLDGEI